jgi:hypothetical protein
MNSSCTPKDMIELQCRFVMNRHAFWLSVFIVPNLPAQAMRF